MAQVGKLYVEEYESDASIRHGSIPGAVDLLVAEHTVAIDNSASAASAAFNDATSLVVLTARGVSAHIELGTAPTAEDGEQVLIQDQPRMYKVDRGQSWKVAVLEAEDPTT